MSRRPLSCTLVKRFLDFAGVFIHENPLSKMISPHYQPDGAKQVGICIGSGVSM